MTIERIISRFKKKGYLITRCFSGKIMVANKYGFSKVFDSYSEAYKYYFN